MRPFSLSLTTASTICDHDAMLTSKTHNFAVEGLDLEMDCSLPSRCTSTAWGLPNNKNNFTKMVRNIQISI